MNSTETQIVRDVLATMVDEAPPPIAFEDLTETRLVRTTDRRRISAPLAALAGFAVVLAVVGGFIAATRPTQQSPATAEATIFLLPTTMPDDLELHLAEVHSNGNATSQVYLPPGETTYAEGDRVVNINVNDSVRMAQAGGIDTSDLLDADASTIFASVIESVETVYTDSELSFEETTIRGRPALLVQRVATVGEITDTAIGVVVIEGNGIITEVDTHQVDRQVVIAIAEGLTATTAEAFAEHGDR
jgi:hypothetical protein